MSIRTFLSAGFLDSMASLTYGTPVRKVGTVLGDTANSLSAFFDSTTFSDRKVAEFSVKLPKVSSDAPNGYTQARSSLFIKMPLALDNGNTTVNSISLTVSTDVETTEAERDELMLAMMDALYQGLSTTAGNYLDDFFHNGSVD